MSLLQETLEVKLNEHKFKKLIYTANQFQQGSLESNAGNLAENSEHRANTGHRSVCKKKLTYDLNDNAGIKRSSFLSEIPRSASPPRVAFCQELLRDYWR